MVVEGKIQLKLWPRNFLLFRRWVQHWVQHDQNQSPPAASALPKPFPYWRAISRLLWNHFCSWGPIFVICQNYTGSSGSISMGNWFVSLKGNTMTYIVNSLWGCKFRGKSNPTNKRGDCFILSQAMWPMGLSIICKNAVSLQLSILSLCIIWLNNPGGNDMISPTHLIYMIEIQAIICIILRNMEEIKIERNQFQGILQKKMKDQAPV